MLRRFAAFTVFVVLLFPVVRSAKAADPAPQPPVKLAVMVVFDQLRIPHVRGGEPISRRFQFPSLLYSPRAWG